MTEEEASQIHFNPLWQQGLMEMHSALAFWEGMSKNALLEISLSELTLGLGQSAEEVSQDCSIPK